MGAPQVDLSNSSKEFTTAHARYAGRSKAKPKAHLKIHNTKNAMAMSCQGRVCSHVREETMPAYDGQHRGDRDAYERYLNGMDASMRQKVALTAAHLLCAGRIADMGMGSGTGSEALAALYPALEVIGVDVDSTAVTMAKERYHLPNLRFITGDISSQVFEPTSLDGIFDSSVLHHVTSFNNYDRSYATKALEVQIRQLRDHGILIVRDFVDPGPETVLLDLPSNDGQGDSPETCSTAQLFEDFSRVFRALSSKPGFAYESVEAPFDPPLRTGWRRFRVSHTLAVEFVLRKDYRTDWYQEAKEEYSYMTQRQFEDLFARLGLRVLASTPIRNPWIVRHRFTDRMELRNMQGEHLDAPATNYVIVGEKVPPGHGVRFRQGAPHAPLGFLVMDHFRDKSTEHVADLVRRPNRTIDVIPWFELQGECFILARMSYPRPIVASDREGCEPLDQSAPAHFVTEPLNILQTDKPVGLTVEDALRELAGIDAQALVDFKPGATYYPSPGGILEEVQSILVQTEPVFVKADIPNLSSFSTSGRIRAIEACQILRAAQVGGLPDARLEHNAYTLLRNTRHSPGPWIGESIAASGGCPPRSVATMHASMNRPGRRRFERAPKDQSTGFLSLLCSSFAELDAQGNEIVSRPLEYVVPRLLGLNTIACAVFRRCSERIWLGLSDDDLPAAQCLNGQSQLWVVPAWRLPREIQTMRAARAFLINRLDETYGLRCGETWELGGRYFPSPGLTPEVVYPMAVEVLNDGPDDSPLRWFALEDILHFLDHLNDGHTRTAALRLAHATGLLTAAWPTT